MFPTHEEESLGHPSDGEGNYVCNDTGAPILPGRELEPESWYDLSALNSFCSGLRGN